MQKWMAKRVQEHKEAAGEDETDDDSPYVDSNEIIQAGIECGILDSEDDDDWWNKCVPQESDAEWYFEEHSRDCWYISRRVGGIKI